jgi:outer membrane protein OmpA-like peptidoglycan-associated protein
MKFKVVTTLSSACLITFTLAFLASCSSKPPKNNPHAGNNPVEAKMAPPPLNTPSMEAKQLANEQETSLVTEFNFKKGKETLSLNSKKKLEEISKKALKKGKIEMIKVITWADQEYPSVKRKNLSSDQISLVQNRNTEIKNYLEKLIPSDNVTGSIELISMAERPTFMKKLISADDARIKRSLESAGIPTTDGIAKKGYKSSRSIVLILLKEQNK